MLSKKINHTLLVLCLISLTAPHKTEASTWDTGVGMTLGGIALAALGSVICYACSESDETATSNAELYNTQASSRYAASVDAFYAFHHLLTYSMVNAYSLIVDELNELYPTAQNLAAMHSTMSDYLSQIKTCINQLQSHLSNVEYRKNSLANKKYRTADETRLLSRMQHVYATMQELLPRLTLYYDYFNLHCAYFDLYECEAMLGITYQQEISYGHTYQYNPLGLGQALRYCVGARFSSYTYPYIAYKNALDTDIQKLQSYIRKAQHYVGRYSAAVQLEQYLIQVRGIIVSDDLYIQEKKSRRAERQYQQQQQLMQQQIMLQQQQIIATQQAAQTYAHAHAHRTR